MHGVGVETHNLDAHHYCHAVSLDSRRDRLDACKACIQKDASKGFMQKDACKGCIQKDACNTHRVERGVAGARGACILEGCVHVVACDERGRRVSVERYIERESDKERDIVALAVSNYET